MDFQQLEYFCEVAASQNMTKSAKQLMVAQPSLSVSIARLEKELGTPLFDRNNNRIYLNEAGQLFYERARDMLVRCQAAREQTSQLANNDKKEVRVVVTSTGLVTRLTAALLTKYPDIQANIYFHALNLAQSLIEEGKADFAISAKPVKSSVVEWMPLLQDELLLMVSVQNPLSQRTGVAAHELVNEPFVVCQSAFRPESEFEDFQELFGFQPVKQIETNEPDILFTAVKLNLGVTVISGLRVWQYDNCKDVALIPIKLENNQRMIGVARLKSHYLNPPAREAFRFTVEYLKALNFDNQS